MTNEEACAYAATWGSLIRGGDPGACMYGFSDDFVMQNEAHRQRCLNWMVGCRLNVLDRPDHYDADELDRMAVFVEKLKSAEVASKQADADDETEQQRRDEKHGLYGGHEDDAN